MTDHSDTPPAGKVNRTLLIARLLAEAGYRVFPCRPFSKAPATENGFKDATTDLDQINTWFDNERGLNLAVACGPQPNGINLLAVDIDPKNGGLETWKHLTDEHGVPMAPRHETPSGGFHLFFDVPDATARTGPAVLGPGVDTRGDGGYVVVPPSRLRDDDGEIITYHTSSSAALARNLPYAGPLWLLALLEPPEPLSVSMRRHPSQQLLSTGDSVADKAREGWFWPGELERDGWTLVRHHGPDSQWTRPGKSPRDGTSATLHGGVEGPLVVWSTSVATGGVETRTGAGRSYSPWDYIVTFRAGGDTKVAAALVREVALDGRSQGHPSVEATTQLYPPLDFYDQRPWMAACRQMAQSVGGSPSAHLLAYLTRWATLIPPGYSIPPINGAPSSFDLLSVIAGTSGAGKTSPMRNVARMLPVTREDLRMGLGIGSGEGIIEAFYGIQISEDDKGKPHKERAKTIAGVNFAVSEGLIFAELAGRGGTTHVTRLCDAWSGAALSTANASAETFRHIAEDQYRLTLMMGIQADQAHLLMTDSAASQGFVGRLLFAWAEEPRVSPRPEAPDSFVLPVPPGAALPAQGGRPKQYLPVFLDYPDEVYAEIQVASDQRVGTNVAVEDHHHDLLRCKVAGILALMDGRTYVSLADWEISTALLACSAAVRNHLYEHRRSKSRDERHSAAVARAEVELVVEDVKDRQGIARMAEAIRRKVIDGSMAVGQVRKKVSASSTRHRFDAALALAVSNGWVVVIEDRVEAV